MIRSLGAERVIDFTKEDITRGGERYDLILDVASTLSLAGCRRVLTPHGIDVFIGHDHFGRARERIVGSVPHFFALIARGRFDAHTPRPPFSSLSQPEVMAVLQVMAAGRLAAVIGMRFPLSEVPAAVRAMQEAGVCGRMVSVP